MNMIDYSIKCKNLLNSYFNWQVDSIKINSDKQRCNFITPFTDPINDNIILSVEFFPSPDTLKITDNARTINMLYHSGVNLGYFATQKSNTAEIFDKLLKKNNLSLEENNIVALCKISNFPLYFNRMIETMLSAFQLINLAKKVPFEKPFKEIFKDFLIESKKKNFTMDFKAESKTEPFLIDFAFSNGVYKFIDTLVPIRETAKILRMQAEAQAFKWMKLKEEKIYNFIPIAVYDNRKISWSELSLSILHQHSDYIISYDNRKEILSIIS